MIRTENTIVAYKAQMRNRYKYLLAIIIPIMVAVIALVIFTVVLESSFSAVTHALKPKLVIDHDGGADDAMAIFMALLYQKHFNGPEVVALTTTHGNVAEDQVFNNSQRILSAANRRDVLIYRGSSSSLVKNDYKSDYFFGLDGLGDNNTDNYEPIFAQKEHAAIGLINLSQKYSDNLIIIALGALTNIALAIRLDPNFMTRLSQLYVAAGHIYGTDFKEPEFNAAMDVESYYVVAGIGSPNKLTFIPFSQIQLYQKISKQWRQNVLGAIDTKLIKIQNQYEEQSINKISYWCLLDPSAMAIVLNESLVVEESRYSNNSINLCDNLIIIALGALTNIALAIRLDPNFITRLSHLYVAAGHIYGTDFKEPEFNAAMDVESYYVVAGIGSPNKLTFIPFSQIQLYQKISKQWRQNVLGAIDTELIKIQNQYEEQSINKISYWCLLDPSAMAIVLNESLVVEESRYSNNSINLCDDKRGINLNNFTIKNEANARIIYSVRKESYKQMLYDIFSSEKYNK